MSLEEAVKKHYIFGKEKIDIEVVPGVSSVVAALADAGIPITHRGIAKKGFRSLQLTAKKTKKRRLIIRCLPMNP